MVGPITPPIVIPESLPCTIQAYTYDRPDLGLRTFITIDGYSWTLAEEHPITCTEEKNHNSNG